MKFAIALLFAPALLLAQSGRWVGSIEVPDQELKIAVDLAKDASGVWAGTVSIPDQHITSIPLSSIKADGSTVSFVIKGMPGDPTFYGQLGSDGKTMKGDYSQGGGTFAFKLARIGEARIGAAPKSTPISKELEGSWQGVLDANGQTFHLVLQLANTPAGAVASIISPDQQNAQFPVSVITQEKSHLTLDIAVGGVMYKGDWRGDTITGQWTQGSSYPLTFKRSK